MSLEGIMPKERDWLYKNRVYDLIPEAPSPVKVKDGGYCGKSGEEMGAVI